ncbi:cytochrome P450 [Trichoderma citrinoviride]|uniref:Cytochrome P450 n=1 Tax=Trichoderma citrinoviride TaxID=58853 RepID=A0A2T4B6U3_9HYPO|nr:cytochrome P450 [Trichoderma citrinoviride]PTB64949.1 cytochrome P450 [Trichoderma citrinoviride]
MGLLSQPIGVSSIINLVISLPLLAVTLGLAYILCVAIYNLFFHPLSGYPGPWLWAVSDIPYSLVSVSGDAHKRMLQIHMQYGPVVRVGPNTVFYSHPDATKEIRGHRKGNKAEHLKDPHLHSGNQSNVIGANRANHVRYRRSLAYGFSHQAMLDQEPIINKYIDTLLTELKKQSTKHEKIDIVRWYNYTTFDIIGDLAFGEPFYCLEKSDFHPWVALIFSGVKNLSFISVCSKHGKLGKILARLLVPKDLPAKGREHRRLSIEKVRRRLDSGSSRPDFMTAMMTTRGSSEELTFNELVSNSSLLIAAGSETTATALSAATYYLGLYPEIFAKLAAEVRSAFSSEKAISLTSVQHLTYLQAVIDEAMRLFPSAPGTQPRIISPGGDMIVGKYVPEGTVVGVWQWVNHHNPAYFHDAESFIPERWLGDTRFESDKRDAFMPFSVGPRNCIGRNLAYLEMRLILARMVWNFDIKLAEESVGWDTRSKVYMLWEKGPIYVYLTRREGD